MIERISYIESPDTSPYHNLALEEHLLLNCREGECILYLWQNQHTVVIGRNQNAWKECLVSKLEEEGGRLVRRLSGGGAVYHDLGNLNFTFLVRKEDYDVKRQTRVILKAVQKLGIAAEKSGRNDILVDGKKFSGNAYYEQGEHCYHHGTLMVRVDLEGLSRYLTVSEEKLKSKGVDSVRSRVTNLSAYVPELTIDMLKEKLLEAFEEEYKLPAKLLKAEELDQHEIAWSQQRFSSWDWIFGKKIDFQHEMTNRFPWGQVTLQFAVKNGRIEEVNAFSDAMLQNPVCELPRYLRGIRYKKQSICAELGLYWSADESEKKMVEDMIGWIKTIDF